MCWEVGPLIWTWWAHVTGRGGANCGELQGPYGGSCGSERKLKRMQDPPEEEHALSRRRAWGIPISHLGIRTWGGQKAGVQIRISWWRWSLSYWAQPSPRTWSRVNYWGGQSSNCQINATWNQEHWVCIRLGKAPVPKVWKHRLWTQTDLVSILPLPFISHVILDKMLTPVRT